jgi:hypothetical protein
VALQQFPKLVWDKAGFADQTAKKTGTKFGMQGNGEDNRNTGFG